MSPNKSSNTTRNSATSFLPTRGLYETANVDHSSYKAAVGITEEVVREISRQKDEPEWMLEKRLAGLSLFQKTPLPTWGPPLDGLHIDSITFFVRPGTGEQTSWDDVPEDIKKTFDRLGIPEAEKKALAGVGAQYDSDVVYHNIKKQWTDKGVIFENMDTAVRECPELVQEHFMTSCVPIHDHAFTMLHAAVWSGGTFIYVPKGVSLDLPLQAYFRMNAEKGGQFEHTLIIADEGSEVHYIEGCSAPRYSANSLHAGCVEIFVRKSARVRYSSIENWSKNTYNLNTKRALIDEDGTIEWVNGNMGSGTTMLYPSSVLRGRGARSDSIGVVFAGPGQNQDTGAKAIHVAPNTSSTIRSKSISVGGGISTYRGLLRIGKNAENSHASVTCDALMLDSISRSHTHPVMNIETDKVDIVHEARVGTIGDDEVFYLMSRGLSEDEALRLVVSGFIEPVVKSLPLEYALELNRLVELEMEGAIG